MEVRSHREQNLQSWIDRAHRELEQACAQVGARFTMERARCTGAVSVPEDSPLIRMLVEIYRELDFEAGPAAGFGGSDTAWLFANGLEAVNLGTGMGNLHSVDEFIRMEDLERVTRVLEKLAAR
jgi:tripeptide aminopeptidase